MRYFLENKGKKNNKLNFLWPRKSLCGSLFCVLSQEMRHINFPVGPKKGCLGGGQKVYVEKVYALFLSPREVVVAGVSDILLRSCREKKMPVSAEARAVAKLKRQIPRSSQEILPH